jgi:hypothetical protein
MQEMAFQDFKFQTFSGRRCPQTPVVMHPLWKTFTPLTNQARSTSAGQNAALASQEYHCNSSSLYIDTSVFILVFLAKPVRRQRQDDGYQYDVNNHITQNK